MRETGGGRFDRDEGFCYFLAAASGTTLRIADRHTHMLVPVDDLFGDRSDFLGLLADPRQKVLLDSGVFWLASRHAEANGLTLPEALAAPPEWIDGWDKLLATYIDLVKLHEADLWGYVEPDQGGADGKRRTRAELEELGLRPIPVYHPLGDGWDYLDELLDAGYDRLMVGNLVQANYAERDRMILSVWERIRRRPRGERPWLHLLGLGPYSSLAALPSNSVDTSNHVQSMRYGALIPGAMALGPFSRLYGYLYDRASGDPETDGLEAYGRMLGWLAHCDEESWRTQRGDLRELFDLETFPDVVEPETEPVPELVR